MRHPKFRLKSAHELSETGKNLGAFERFSVLESVKDTDGNVIKEPPLPIWANFRQRALDIAILEINNKMDLRIMPCPEP